MRSAAVVATVLLVLALAFGFATDQFRLPTDRAFLGPYYSFVGNVPAGTPLMRQHVKPGYFSEEVPLGQRLRSRFLADLVTEPQLENKLGTKLVVSVTANQWLTHAVLDSN